MIKQRRESQAAYTAPPWRPWECSHARVPVAALIVAGTIALGLAASQSMPAPAHTPANSDAASMTGDEGDEPYEPVSLSMLDADARAEIIQARVTSATLANLSAHSTIERVRFAELGHVLESQVAGLAPELPRSLHRELARQTAVLCKAAATQDFNDAQAAAKAINARLSAL